LAPT